MATLEFAMCLPVLLVLFGAILWLGVLLNVQAEVTIEARQTAWHDRHAGSESDPFRLNTVVGVVTPPPVDRDVSFSAMFPARAQSVHMVLGGAWDHHQVEMNREQPNRRLYGTIAKGIAFDWPRIDIGGGARALLSQLNFSEGDARKLLQEGQQGKRRQEEKRNQHSAEVQQQVAQLEMEKRSIERNMTNEAGQRELATHLSRIKAGKQAIQYREEHQPGWKDKSRIPFTQEWRERTRLESQVASATLEATKSVSRYNLSEAEQQMANEYADVLLELQAVTQQ